MVQPVSISETPPVERSELFSQEGSQTTAMVCQIVKHVGHAERSNNSFKKNTK